MRARLKDARGPFGNLLRCLFSEDEVLHRERPHALFFVRAMSPCALCPPPLMH